MSGLDTINAFNASGSITDVAANTVALGTDTTGNYVADVDAGNAITVSGTAGEGTTFTVNHSDTSSQASVNNSGSTFIQDVTLDTYGHVTGLTSATVSTGGSNNNTSTTAVGAYAMVGATNPVNTNVGTGTSFSGNSSTYQYGGVTGGTNNYSLDLTNPTVARNGNIPSGTWHFRGAGGQNTARCTLAQRTA